MCTILDKTHRRRVLVAVSAVSSLKKYSRRNIYCKKIKEKQGDHDDAREITAV